MPAAAVIQRWLALFGITGLKGGVGGLVSWYVKSLGLTEELRLILPDLRLVGERGIPGVAGKCADIRRNTYSEGSTLGRY